MLNLLSGILAEHITDTDWPHRSMTSMFIMWAFAGRDQVMKEVTRKNTLQTSGHQLGVLKVLMYANDQGWWEL